MSLDVRLEVRVDVGGKEPHVFTLFEANTTHNLNTMAEAAGIYRHVWRPEELPEIKTAGDLIQPLRDGIRKMEDDPRKFIALNPENGWGNYADFLQWLRRYVEACIEFPKATISTDR